MYELVQAAKDTYYIESPSKMGLFACEGGAVLIDSGNGKDAAKKALRHIAQNGWALKTILNTHCHADHIGGNAYLLAQTGAAAYSAGVCAAFARNPELGLGLLYGGFPPKELKNRLMLAEPSAVGDVSEAVLPEGMALLPLPGHCPDMFGVFTPDGVCFLADSVTSEQVLQKYHVTLVYDVAAHLETLSTLEILSANLFVPAHAPATEDIRPLARLNRQKTEEITGLVLSLSRGGRTLEDILKGVFEHYGISADINQYTLLKTTVLSYLTYLTEKGLAVLEFSENRAVYRQA